MADDLEQGPDPNDVRRHAKKMLTEIQYRQKYRRLDFYKPNPKQLLFHNNPATELMLRAGNQMGKTHAAGAQMTMDALSLYPDWYKGRRFIVPPKIERPHDFVGWYGCTTGEKTRDGAQVKLLGDIRLACRRGLRRCRGAARGLASTRHGLRRSRLRPALRLALWLRRRLRLRLTHHLAPSPHRRAARPCR